MVGFQKAIELKENKGGMRKRDKDTFHLKHIVADKKRGLKIKDKILKNKREIEKKKRKNNQGIESTVHERKITWMKNAFTDNLHMLCGPFVVDVKASTQYHY